MRYSKFKQSLWPFLMLLSPISQAFNATDCLQSNYQTEVSHKLPPFGILEKTLKISKNKCEIQVETNRWWFFSTHWMIDVCRGPIHIKVGNTGVEVVRKNSPCLSPQQDDFCRRVAQLDQFLQDDGLIFAEGEKSNLSAPHGQVYCSYFLIKSYLERDLIFGPKIYENQMSQELQGTDPSASQPEESGNDKEQDLFERVDQKLGSKFIPAGEETPQPEPTN